MKKLLYIFLSCAVLSTACEPNEEIYEELDKQLEGAPTADIALTLADADYALAIPGENDDAIGANKSFNGIEEVKQYVPNILAAKYPQLGGKSSALVTYNLYRGNAPEISAYTSADAYAVSDDDYLSLGGDAADYKLFTREQAPQANVPAILSNSVTGYEEGDVLLVNYKYADEVVDPSVTLTMDKPEYQVLVDYIKTDKGSAWVDSYGTLEYYYGAGAYYKNFEGRASKFKQWRTDNNLTDDLFEGSASAEEDSLRVQGRIEAGLLKFLELQYPNAVSQINGADVFYNLTYNVYYGFSGGTVAYNVQYQSDDNGSFEQTVAPTTNEIPSSSVSESRGAYYTLTAGGWEAVGSDVYYLSSADYDAMGAPGKYDNFSSSVSADNYLPAFLRAKYPYAQEEDQKIITYKYYSSSAKATVVRGDLYTFLNGNWEKYQSKIAESLQFGFEAGAWVPDNTIKYALTGDDFALIGATFEKAAGDVDKYNNINMGKHSEEEILAYLNAVLKNKFPNAAVGQKYLVSFATYNPRGVAERHLILNEEGNYVIKE